MDKEYKLFVVDSLHGLIDGNSTSLQHYMVKHFKTRFSFDADSIVVIQENKVNNEKPPSWIGTMTATIVVNGKSFSHTRDFGAEYEIDIRHPDYDSDDWFYESDKCENRKKHREIKAIINNLL